MFKKHKKKIIIVGVILAVGITAYVFRGKIKGMVSGGAEAEAPVDTKEATTE
jgi:hypothetical protein